jgi:hypothetical protein
MLLTVQIYTVPQHSKQNYLPVMLPNNLKALDFDSPVDDHRGTGKRRCSRPGARHVSGLYSPRPWHKKTELGVSSRTERGLIRLEN